MYRYKLILQRYLGIKWLTFELGRAKYPTKDALNDKFFKRAEND